MSLCVLVFTLCDDELMILSEKQNECKSFFLGGGFGMTAQNR